MLAELESQLGFTIHSVSAVSGGDINQAYKIESASGPFFLKANKSSFAADMFACEVDGLEGELQSR